MTKDISDRDAVMLKMLRDGLTSAQISEKIGVKVATVIRRVNLMRERGLISKGTKWSSGYHTAEDEARLVGLVLAKTPRGEICRIMNRSNSRISARIAMLRSEGAFDDDAKDCPKLRADHAGFMAALRADYWHGAGEKLDAPREAIGHFSPVEAQSSVGSPALSCAGN
jgi:hypothetical protein